MVRSGAVPRDDRRRALLLEYFDVLRGGPIERLHAILAADYRDNNPLRGQLPGRPGVIMKAMLFRADHPDARIVVEEITLTGTGARATWTTTARGLNGASGEATWRFSGAFEIDETIRSSDVDVMELLRPS